jgi:thiosulfate reductase cytochrome b subunit
MLVEKHARWIRWTHWLNFPLLSLMIWSGLLIYWANDVYRPFFPEGFYQALGLDHRLSHGMSIHFTVMWLYTLNGLAYLGFLLVSGEWREIVPTLRTFREAPAVVLHDLGLRKSLPSQGKLNAAQRIAYTGVLLLGAASVASGLAIYKPVQLKALTSLFLGYSGARLAHFAVALLFVAFFVLHVAQVARAGWENFRGMLAGFEVRSR